LGNSGVRFKNAYSNNPMCGPSRASLFTGVYPHNSSHFWMKPWLENDVLINTKTIMEKFKESGYYVVGSGKVLHHNKLDVWTEYKYKADYSPFVYAGDYNSEKKPISQPDVPAPFRTNRIVDGLNMGGGFIDGYYDDAVEKNGNHTPAGVLRGGKYSLFEAGTRVPFITYWKGKIMPKKSNSLVSQLDLFSSLAKLTGSDLRADDSIDLMDTFMGKSDEGRSELILEATTRTAFRSGDWVMIPPYRGPAVLKAVNIEIANSQKYQLYNLSNDISQKVNLAESEPEKLQEMNSRFTEIRGEGYNQIKKLELK
jgi:arylsulfatase A-like enzyme